MPITCVHGFARLPERKLAKWRLEVNASVIGDNFDPKLLTQN